MACNHISGETIAEGFNSLYYFEKAAETYIKALSTNKDLNIVSHEIAEKTSDEAMLTILLIQHNNFYHKLG